MDRVVIKSSEEGLADDLEQEQMDKQLVHCLLSEFLPESMLYDLETYQSLDARLDIVQR